MMAFRKACKPLPIIAFALLLWGMLTSTHRADDANPQSQIQFKKVSNFIIPPVLEGSARGQEQNDPVAPKKDTAEPGGAAADKRNGKGDEAKKKEKSQAKDSAASTKKFDPAVVSA